jgi:hypothetical protein
VETGSRVDLPPNVSPPYEVYVNGVPQTEGTDYEVVGASLVFGRTLAREGKLGFWRWLSMLLGIAGTYRKHDSIDLVYSAGDRRVVAALAPADSDPPLAHEP